MSYCSEKSAFERKSNVVKGRRNLFRPAPKTPTAQELTEKRQTVKYLMKKGSRN